MLCLIDASSVSWCDSAVASVSVSVSMFKVKLLPFSFSAVEMCKCKRVRGSSCSAFPFTEPTMLNLAVWARLTWLASSASCPSGKVVNLRLLPHLTCDISSSGFMFLWVVRGFCVNTEQTTDLLSLCEPNCRCESYLNVGVCVVTPPPCRRVSVIIMFRASSCSLVHSHSKESGFSRSADASLKLLLVRCVCDGERRVQRPDAKRGTGPQKPASLSRRASPSLILCLREVVLHRVNDPFTDDASVIRRLTLSWFSFHSSTFNHCREPWCFLGNVVDLV